MPDDTPTSTATPSRARRNKLLTVATWVFAAVVLWYVGKGLLEQWSKFRNVPLTVHPQWGMIALSAALYFGGFLVLIETWRRMLRGWGESLGFRDACAIFFTSALVRYLPGSTVIQVGALAELSRRRKVSPAAATGASLINTAVNIASGFVVALLGGYGVLNTVTGGYATLGLVVAAVVLLGLFALPLMLSRMLVAFKAVTGRDLAIGHLPVSAIYTSLVGNLLGWILYGLSYRVLVAGILGEARGATTTYIAVYAAAYVVGYLVFFTPAGVGVREGVQVDALAMLGLANSKQALVVAGAARLLSMLLEIVPGLFFLSRGTRPQEPTDRHGSNH